MLRFSSLFVVVVALLVLVPSSAEAQMGNNPNPHSTVILYHWVGEPGESDLVVQAITKTVGPQNIVTWFSHDSEVARLIAYVKMMAGFNMPEMTHVVDIIDTTEITGANILGEYEYSTEWQILFAYDPGDPSDGDAGQNDLPGGDM